MSLFSVEKTLTLAAAKQVAEAAEKFAVANNWKVVIAVVDSGANLLYLERMDGGLVGSVSIAERKARTAVQFKCTDQRSRRWPGRRHHKSSEIGHPSF